MWDVTSLQINQPTLADVFLLTKRIELNMVEEMVTLWFQGQTTHPWSIQPQTQHGQLNKNWFTKIWRAFERKSNAIGMILGTITIKCNC